MLDTVMVSRIKYSPHIFGISCVLREEKNPKSLSKIMIICSLQQRTNGTKCAVHSEDGATVFDFIRKGKRQVWEICFRQRALLTEIYSSGIVREAGCSWLRDVWETGLSQQVGHFKTLTLWGRLWSALHARLSVVTGCSMCILFCRGNIFNIGS